MAWRGSGLFRDGAILVLFSKYGWYRKLGYPAAEAAEKARWRAGIQTVTRPEKPLASAKFVERPREFPATHSR